MDSPADRKDAIRRYLEQAIPQGVFAITCGPTAQVWVGASTNLDAARNSAWFSLRSGSHRHVSLRQAWAAHGEAAFAFETVEQLDAEVSTFEVRDLLRRKKIEWAARLNAETLLP